MKGFWKTIFRISLASILSMLIYLICSFPLVAALNDSNNSGVIKLICAILANVAVSLFMVWALYIKTEEEAKVIREDYQEQEYGFLEDVKTFIHSYEFMQLGQAVNRKQWQAAGMKIQKMSAKAKKMGMTGWGNQFMGMKQNIAHKNEYPFSANITPNAIPMNTYPVNTGIVYGNALLNASLSITEPGNT